MVYSGWGRKSWIFFPSQKGHPASQRNSTENDFFVVILQDLSALSVCSHLKWLQVIFMDSNLPVPTLKCRFPQNPEAYSSSALGFSSGNPVWCGFHVFWAWRLQQNICKCKKKNKRNNWADSGFNNSINEWHMLRKPSHLHIVYCSLAVGNHVS